MINISHEPDYLEFIDSATGYKCQIIRIRPDQSGHLCGYVEVPNTHPLYGKEYNELSGDFNVHGGITYSGECFNENTVLNGGYQKDTWCFGFDCAHSGDIQPKSPYNFNSSATYKDINYVKNECRDLAAALKQHE